MAFPDGREEAEKEMGWNGSGQRGAAPVQPKVTAKKPSPVRGLVAGGAVVVLAAVAYFAFFAGGNESVKDQSDRKRGRITEVKPSKAGKDGKALERGDVSRAGQKEVAEKDGKPVESAANDAGLSDLPTPGEMPTPPPRKETFDNPSDQLISMTINGNGGQIAPLPFSNNMDEEFRKSLEKPIVINDDDSEEVKAAKQRVLEAREDIKALMKEGKSVRQILEEHREDVNFKAEMRSQVAKEARAILESGDAEGAKKFVMMMNFALQQKGIEEVEMPLTKEQRREQILQRALERKAQRETNQ